MVFKSRGKLISLKCIFYNNFSIYLIKYYVFKKKIGRLNWLGCINIYINKLFYNGNILFLYYKEYFFNIIRYKRIKILV